MSRMRGGYYQMVSMGNGYTSGWKMNDVLELNK